jgi:hypothetical protein
MLLITSRKMESGDKELTGRSRTALLWLASVALLWAVLAFIARIPTTRAVKITNVLFVLTLPLTYVAILGAVVCASSRRREAAKRAAAITLGLILALGLFELAAAALLVHWQLVFMALRGEEQHYVPDPDLGFRHAPSIRWSGRQRSDVETAWGLPASASDPITFTHDAHGFRNPTPLARADIVLIGDSYVEGEYVSDDQIVSRFLQARLNRSVANLGVAGYGPAQELIVLERDGMALKPEIVIWFFYEGNDLYDDQEFENTLVAPREVRASAWTERRGWWPRSLMRNAHAQLRLLLYPIVPGQSPHFGTLAAGRHRGQKILFGTEASLPWNDFERSRWEKAQETFREGIRLTRKQNIHLLLVYIPIKFRVYRDFVELPKDSEARDWSLWPLPDLFLQFCRTERLACLDLTGLFRGSVGNGDMPYAIADSHWSPEGHRLTALWIAKTLESLGWVPAPNGPPSRSAGQPSVTGGQ